MLKQIFMMHSTEIGLVLFFLSFIVIAVYAITRSRKELSGWSNLPLEDSSGHETRKTDEGTQQS